MTGNSGSVSEGDLLWTPRADFAAAANVTHYQAWLERTRGRAIASYDELWQWSVDDPEAFWGSLWRYFDVQSSEPYRSALSDRNLPGCRWFEGSLVNYTEHLLRHEEFASPDEVAVLHATETQPLASVTWRELGSQVRILATRMRALGIRPGDRVVSYMPNVPATVIAMMATTAIGAVWSSAAPEFGVRTVIDRFAQIAPTLLFAADGYRFGGRTYPRGAEVGEILAALPSLRHVVWLPQLGEAAPPPADPRVIAWQEMVAGPAIAREVFEYERVGCEHPLWIVFSSGTTGLPKPIVHGHVGVLIEHLKLVSLHMNLRRGSRLLFYTTTGWMMWNVVIAALHAGAAAVLYDGNPLYPGPDRLWQLAEEARVTHFGASPTFVQLREKVALEPGKQFDLSSIEMITVSGSPCTPETFAWVYRAVKSDVWVASQSGGTELCSSFVGAVPTLPVYAGEIQSRMLGMDVHAWSDDGRELFDEVGELVVTTPFPSMPVSFWNDKDDRRYRETYFEQFPGVWRHGDFIKINARGGCYVYGRSDSTLNRHGVRIGTAEVYRSVEKVPGVEDSLVVCCERPDGSFFMPLFVRLKSGMEFGADMTDAIRRQLRSECSPRHVPDCIVAVDAIPYTLTGKKMEAPVRKLLMGVPVELAASRGAMSNPNAIDFYVNFAAAHVPSATVGKDQNGTLK